MIKAILVTSTAVVLSASVPLVSAAPSSPATVTAPPVATAMKETDQRATTSSPFEVGGDPRTEGIAGGLVFVPINPFRTYDSRNSQFGSLKAGFIRTFEVWTLEDDTPAIPSSAVAVTYNLTATETVGAGYLAVFPADIDWPGNSSINWTASGVTLANGGVVAVANTGGLVAAISVYNGLSSPQTHFVVDITGYYI